MIIIPDIPDIKDIITPPQSAPDTAYDMTDIILRFVVNTFNSLLSVSRTIIQWFTTEMTIGSYSASPLEFMLGVFLPVFLAYSLIKWVTDILS